MWQGKLKAITFSFDDGVTQDKRAIEILNKYNLKATFNLNSGLLGQSARIVRNNVEVNHTKLQSSKVKEIYMGHEIAAHTLTHPTLIYLSDEDIVKQVEQDRVALSKLCGYEVVGMAYPGGGVNNDDRVAKVIRENTGIKYVRTTTSTYNFDKQTNLFRFNPSVYYIEDNLFDVVNNFINTKSDKPQLLYIWGHTYEMDAGYISWEKFEELCKLVSNREDIFYGTNREVLL